MTAEGKITTARIRAGDRIMVHMYEAPYPDGTNARESATKVKDATPATVESIVKALTTTGQSARHYVITGSTDDGRSFFIGRSGPTGSVCGSSQP